MARADILGYNKDIINNTAVNAVIGVIFFVLATTLGAYVRIPVPGTPIPITLQTFFVILSGAVLGKRLGVCSQLGYLLLGACGLPVFQGYSSGMAHILGPTGGYLIGFVLASAFVGKMTEPHDLKAYRVIAAFLIGNIILYSLGMLWLIFLYNIDFLKAFSIGALPFIPVEAAKIIIAVLIYSSISRRSKTIFSV